MTNGPLDSWRLRLFDPSPQLLDRIETDWKLRPGVKRRRDLEMATGEIASIDCRKICGLQAGAAQIDVLEVA